LSTRTVLIVVICLPLLSCSTTTLKFSGAVEPISSPILLQYAPYTATQVTVTEVSFTAPGTLANTHTSRTTCEVQIIKQVRGLRSINSCTEYTEGKSNEYQFTADISPLGKYSNVEYNDSRQNSDDEKENQLIDSLKQGIENNESYVIRNPIVSGSSIFKIRASDFLRMFNINTASDATFNDVVRGWGTYEGRRVLVAEINIDETFSISATGTLRIRMSGYKIIDAKTMAILSSKGAATADLTDKGETARLEMNMTSATSLK